MRSRPPSRSTAAAVLVLALTACRPHPRSPLARAAAEGRLADIESLLAAGAPIEGEDGSTFTPLVWAARAGQVEAIRLLLSRGADPDRPVGGNDWPPALHAIHKNQTQAALVLVDAGDGPDGILLGRALMMAAGYANAPMVRALLERGADPRHGSWDGLTVLTHAVGGAWDIDYTWTGCGPHTETVRALLERAPDLTLPDNVWGRLAIAQARRKGCGELLALVGSRVEDGRAR